MLVGRGGRDRLDGGAGDDFLYGQGRLAAGAGKDHLVTFFEGARRSIVSRLFGGAGSDHFLTGNGAQEIVDCGPGADVVITTIDPLHSDRRRDRFTHSCERGNIF
jgi:Ca2+-binding RTX toxin-like protein